MAPAPRTDPQPAYKQSVVLYYWTQCRYCKDFAPVFEDVVAQLPNGVKVYEIEVAQHRNVLEQYGVDLGSGVPRLELFDAQGDVMVYQGPRDSVEPVLAAITQHLHLAPLQGGAARKMLSGGQKAGYSQELQYLLSLIRANAATRGQEEEEDDEDIDTLSSLEPRSPQSASEYNSGISTMGDAEDDGDLSSILVSPHDIKAPALVLYFTQRCPHCVAFKPTYKQLVGNNQVPSDVMVCAVDVQAHQGALQSLQQQAQSGGVPHVVMVSRSGYQTPFAAQRTVENLLDFIGNTMNATGTGGKNGAASEDDEEELEGGAKRKLKFGDKPQKTTMRRMLSDALDSLQELAASQLGEQNRELFEKKHSAVCYVAWLCSAKQPSSDRMYMIMVPRSRRVKRESEVGAPSSVVAEFPVFAVIFGKRKGPLSARIFTQHDPVTLVRQKARAGYKKARETDVVSQAMHDMGYTVRIDYGAQVVHI